MFYNMRNTYVLIRSKVFPQEDAIYIVSRPLQKLGGDFKKTPCVHNGYKIVCIILMDQSKEHIRQG